MKFTLASCVAALAAIVAAKPQFTNSNFDVVYGQPFELKWSGASGPVTIELKSGTPPKGLKTLKTLGSGLTGTSLTVVLNDIPTGQYAFTVRDGEGEDNTNYSEAFPIVGTSASVSSSSVSSTTSRPVTSSASFTSTTATSSSNSSSAFSAPTSSSTGTSTTSSRATSATPTTSASNIPNSNSSGTKVQSSLALVLLGAVAYAFLN